jgi:hypothetical protein
MAHGTQSSWTLSSGTTRLRRRYRLSSARSSRAALA